MSFEENVPTYMMFGLRKADIVEVIRECKLLRDHFIETGLQNEKCSHRVVQAIGSGEYRVLEYQSWDQLTDEEKEEYGIIGKPLSCTTYTIRKDKLEEISRKTDL